MISIIAAVFLLAIAGGGIAFRRYITKQAAAILANDVRDRYDVRKDTNEDLKIIGTVTAFVATALAVLVVVLGSLSFVGSNEVGVPVTFGKVGTPLQSGPHFTAPWTSVDKFPTRPVTVELSNAEGSEGDAVTAATSQAGRYTVEISARWATDRERANRLYLQARTGDEDKISTQIVAKSLRQAVNDVYAGFTNVDANAQRAAVSGLVQTRLSALLSPYGIDITDVNLRSASPDDATKAAIASLAAEQQKTKVAEQAKLTAIADAATRVQTAKGIADAAAQTAHLTGESYDAACLAAWERVVTQAANDHVSVYTSPCGDGGSASVLAK